MALVALPMIAPVSPIRTGSGIPRLCIEPWLARHRNPCGGPPAATLDVPTTAKLLLIPIALLVGPPSVPISVMRPFRHTTACTAPEAVADQPTTAPALFRSLAALDAPPSVPRSTTREVAAPAGAATASVTASAAASAAHRRPPARLNASD